MRRWGNRESARRLSTGRTDSGQPICPRVNAGTARGWNGPLLGRCWYERKADLGLTRYATSELRERVSHIERCILELQAPAIEDARAGARAIADPVGVPLEDILHAPTPIRKGRVGRARDVDPDNAEQDCNGLGRKPRWSVAWLEQGRALDDLRAGPRSGIIEPAGGFALFGDDGSETPGLLAGRFTLWRRLFQQRAGLGDRLQHKCVRPF